MSYYPPQNFILVYGFKVLSVHRNCDKMEKRLQDIIVKCEEYAKTSGISLDVITDTFTYDGEIGVNLHFKIHGDQDSVLSKVASLFRFAELNKLGFCNQTFLTE